MTRLSFCDCIEVRILQRFLETIARGDDSGVEARRVLDTLTQGLKGCRDELCGAVLSQFGNALKFALIAHDARTGDYRRNLSFRQKNVVTERSYAFGKYQKIGGAMTEEEFDMVSIAEPTQGDMLQACTIIQSGAVPVTDLSDDLFLRTLAKLVAVCKGEEDSRKMQPMWLIPEAYLLLGRIGK